MLNTTLVFLELPSIDHAWADERLLRLLFQNLVVEDKREIREATMRAWKSCLAVSSTEDPDRLTKNAGPHVDKWFAILSTPIGTAINPALFWSAKASLSGQGAYVHNVDKALLNQDLSLVSVEAVMRGRVAGAVALGTLIAAWPFGVSSVCPSHLIQSDRFHTDSRSDLRHAAGERSRRRGSLPTLPVGDDHRRMGHSGPDYFT